MTRLFAVLGAIFCFGIILPMVITEDPVGDAGVNMVIVHAIIKFIFGLSLLLYCGFATLHAISFVEDPNDRVGWVVLTLGLNVLGSLIYYLTKYQDFRKQEMGGLLSARRMSS